MWWPTPCPASGEKSIQNKYRCVSVVVLQNKCTILQLRRPYDRKVALHRMRDIPNVTVTTTEAVLFELLGTEEHPAYDAICRMMKEYCTEQDFEVA